MTVDTATQPMVLHFTEDKSPADIIRDVEKSVVGDFMTPAHKDAHVLKELWRHKEKTKAAILLFVDKAILENRWLVFYSDGTMYWETPELWLEFALNNLEVYGSQRTTILAWALVLAPFLREHQIKDPTNAGARITPAYCLATAGWGKIGDIATAWYKMSKKDAIGLLDPAERDEMLNRMAVTTQWICNPKVRRVIKDPTDEEKKYCLRTKLVNAGWRIPRVPPMPDSLGGKPYATIPRGDDSLLILAGLSQDEVDWLVENLLHKIISIDEWPYGLLGVEVKAEETDV